jgi:hypothetical protein
MIESQVSTQAKKIPSFNENIITNASLKIMEPKPMHPLPG